MKKTPAPDEPRPVADAMPGDLQQRLRRQTAAAAKHLAETAQPGETPPTADELFAEALAAEVAKLAPPVPPEPPVPSEDKGEK